MADSATLLASNSVLGPYFPLTAACLFCYGNELPYIYKFWVWISSPKLHSTPLICTILKACVSAREMKPDWLRHSLQVLVFNTPTSVTSRRQVLSSLPPTHLLWHHWLWGIFHTGSVASVSFNCSPAAQQHQWSKQIQKDHFIHQCFFHIWPTWLG